MAASHQWQFLLTFQQNSGSVHEMLVSQQKNQFLSSTDDTIQISCGCINPFNLKILAEIFFPVFLNFFLEQTLLKFSFYNFNWCDFYDYKAMRTVPGSKYYCQIPGWNIFNLFKLCITRNSNSHIYVKCCPLNTWIM